MINKKYTCQMHFSWWNLHISFDESILVKIDFTGICKNLAFVLPDFVIFVQ